MTDYHDTAARPAKANDKVSVLCYTLYTMAKNVTIYSADWCAFCHAAKDYLTKKGVNFEEKNVEENQQFAMESVQKSGQMGIPVLDIDGEIIVGFDRPRIDAALAA
jgi:glutaredoxin-like YruB-family protein